MNGNAHSAANGSGHWPPAAAEAVRAAEARASVASAAASEAAAERDAARRRLEAQAADLRQWKVRLTSLSVQSALAGTLAGSVLRNQLNCQ